MIKIYTDSAMKTRESSAGIAARFIVGDQQFEVTEYFPTVYDNHQAEFLAVERALLYVVERQWQDQLLWLHSDSKIVVQSIEKHYAKHEQYAKVLTRILSLMDQCPLCFVKWVPEKENQAADALARRVLLAQKKLY